MSCLPTHPVRGQMINLKRIVMFFFWVLSTEMHGSTLTEAENKDVFTKNRIICVKWNSIICCIIIDNALSVFWSNTRKPIPQYLRNWANWSQVNSLLLIVISNTVLSYISTFNCLFPRNFFISIYPSLKKLNFVGRDSIGCWCKTGYKLSPLDTLNLLGGKSFFCFLFNH